MRARLTVENGAALPRVCELGAKDVALLGRHRDNTLVLQDRHASRRQARIFAEKSSWYISDLHATNATRLDGVAIQRETPLRDGQVISIGGVRVRFNVLPTAGPMPDEPQLVPAPSVEESDTAEFQADEMTALFRFMNDSLGTTTPQQLVSLALQTSLRQTRADLAGYLGLDEDNPDLRLVEPAQASVDRHLSRQLTQAVRRTGRTVWLCAPESQEPRSDSLAGIHDGVCVPLRARRPGGAGRDEVPLGALHVYKSNQEFTLHQVRFLEVLAASLSTTLGNQRDLRALEADNSRLRVRAATSSEELVGASPAMSQLRQQIGRLAASPATVLIFGESGVGKELVALALHHQSARANGPLVTVNCAAISGSMAESELFGHVRGAFTGAVRDHPGYFAQADMGTLFLDELGELSLDLQAKLLRAIESKCFRPVGARADVRADVRIIAATNRDLEKEVREGNFRRDLFFRLTSQLSVPPLRDHLEDVPELVQHFLDHLRQEYPTLAQLSEAALQRLQTYSWPGNVRQLRSVLEGCLALCPPNGTIHATDLHLPADDLSAAEEDQPPSLNLEELELWAIKHALARTGNNNTQAARLLGVHRSTLIEKLKRYQIERGE